jgi:hypothetical protein
MLLPEQELPTEVGVLNHIGVRHYDAALLAQPEHGKVLEEFTPDGTCAYLEESTLSDRASEVSP